MGGELRDKVASGVAWNMAEKAGSMLLQAVVSLVVLRLLMPEDLPEAYDALLSAVEKGTISQERLDQSVLRILQLKEKYDLI